MTEAVKMRISAELEHKRRTAQQKAVSRRVAVYTQYPELAEFDRSISNCATEFSKRLIEGESIADEMKSALSELCNEKNAFMNKNGIDEKDFEPVYDCKKCGDTGYVDGMMCVCFKKRLIEENFKSSNIGAFLTHQSFAGFDMNYYSDERTKDCPTSPRENMKRVYGHCRSFADCPEKSKSLMFIGGTGLGKTFLSTCIARELLVSGKSVIYISAVDFFQRIEKARFDSENTDVSQFCGCDLLIIDDLGTEAPSVYTTAVFSDILDKRVMSERRMIISSNHRISDFEKLYGERVYSRLIGFFDILMFFGKDVRIQKYLNKAD